MGTRTGMPMTASECCGRRPRAITIDVADDQSLSLLVCDTCEQKGWFKNGEPVDITEVKDAASARWNRKQNR